MKRAARRDSAGGAGCTYESCEILRAFPEIYAFLTQEKWDDGAARVPGTIMWVAEDGLFKVWLNDKDAGRSCWLSGPTLSEAMAQAEQAISGTGGQWRLAKPASRGNSRR